MRRRRAPGGRHSAIGLGVRLGSLGDSPLPRRRRRRRGVVGRLGAVHASPPPQGPRLVPPGVDRQL